MHFDQDTQISNDGLRYKSKEAGSQFLGSGGIGSMSCIKCGMHKARSLGVFKKYIGKPMFICAECNSTHPAKLPKN